MDLIDNTGETRQDKASESIEANGAKKTIFELTDESVEGKQATPEDDKADQSKNFLEKLHIRNHELNSAETIYEIYREEIPEAEKDTDLLSEEDEYLFNEVQKAVAEKDIIDLRANLQAISRTVSSSPFNAEDIEKYIDGDTDIQDVEFFQHDLKSDTNLASEISLHTEINEAIGEKDIMQLRSDIRAIFLTESSHSRSLEEIDQYVSGEMDEASVNLFENEMISNKKLSSDVKLFNEIDEAIGEKDIMDLRKSLIAIANDGERLEIRGVKKGRSFKLNKGFWYSVAASIVFIIGINQFSYNYSSSNPKIYSEFYQIPEFSSGTTRSVMTNEESLINQALTLLNRKEYDEALELFSVVHTKDRNNSAANFYSGTIYQLKEQYPEAVLAYQKVVKDGDNLFVEQTDWYLGLCYLKLNEREKAIGQFRKISEGEGFYSQQSVSILKKLE